MRPHRVESLPVSLPDPLSLARSGRTPTEESRCLSGPRTWHNHFVYATQSERGSKLLVEITKAEQLKHAGDNGLPAFLGREQALP